MGLLAFGRIILFMAIALLLMGLLLIGLAKLTGGRWLPGDIVIRRGPSTIFIPIVTSILISILLTIIINVILWIFSRGR